MHVGKRPTSVLIAGGGPAGSSLAIRLVTRGFDVTLVEREKFPRHKLCGEFISPECLLHFVELGVREQMLASGGERITKTVFYDAAGRSIAVPCKWFATGGAALSLSRAEMDHKLLERAREVGVDVREEASVVGFGEENGRVTDVRVRGGDNSDQKLSADIFVDATGRASVLARLLEKRSKGKTPKKRKGLVGFKTHLKNTNVEPGCCEIYSFHGGYGGLSPIENGSANLCFLVRSEIVRDMNGDADGIMGSVVLKNTRAFATLSQAERVSDWLAVSVDGFGLKNLDPAVNVFTIGDSAAFIDPFTGSGMLMAFESSELLARIISTYSSELKTLAMEYRLSFERRFATRLRICSMLRRAAFSPAAAKVMILLLKTNSVARQLVARSTRGRASLDAG